MANSENNCGGGGAEAGKGKDARTSAVHSLVRRIRREEEEMVESSPPAVLEWRHDLRGFAPRRISPSPLGRRRIGRAISVGD
ncbi:unnamed protein product [Spirodela intermedia]|uniref:Uncharacterized protein n=1 Tax=Spirodela intermedia TaxID=51605 RepID=A0A7I8KUB5_SPIIN|nr:unnamed protein product [Spirodela intermedia]